MERWRSAAWSCRGGQRSFSHMYVQCLAKADVKAEPIVGEGCQRPRSTTLRWAACPQSGCNGCSSWCALAWRWWRHSHVIDAVHPTVRSIARDVLALDEVDQDDIVVSGCTWRHICGHHTHTDQSPEYLHSMHFGCQTSFEGSTTRTAKRRHNVLNQAAWGDQR